MRLLGRTHHARSRLFTNLAVSLDAGLPVERALALLAGPEGSRKPASLPGLAAAVAAVRRGEPLADAFRAAEMLDEVELAALEVGETGGRLPMTLRRLARAAARRGDLLDRFARRLIYPLVLVHGAVLLPPLYLLVRGGLGAYLGRVVPVLVLLWLAGAGIVLVLRKGHRLNPSLDRALLRVPLLGQAIGSLAAARYADALQLLLAAGVPFPETLDRAADASGHAIYRAAGHRVAEKVRRGEALYPALAGEGLFPPILVEAVGVGEGAGRLEETVAKAEEALREDAEQAAAWLAMLLTGLAWLVAALVVLWSVLGFWGGYAQTLREVGSAG